MIRTNLATRPFYNTRAVRAVLGVAVLVVVAITAFNIVQFVRLSATQRTLGAQAQEAEQQAAALRAEAAQIMSRIDARRVEVVSDAAREANDIIDQRTFSWTALFAYLEDTLPADARITRVTPRPREDVVEIGAQARTVEDLDAFIEALEGTGAFRDVLATDEVMMENETIEAVIRARYVPPRGEVTP